METKDTMICTLENAGISIRPAATIREIRQLYTSVVGGASVPAEIEVKSTMADTRGKHAENISAPAPPEVDVKRALAEMGGDNATNIEIDQGSQNESHCVTPEDEVASLRKRLEILELREKIKQLETRSNEPVTQSPTIIKFEEFIDKFSGDNSDQIEQWLRELERAFLPYKMNETTKFYNARRLLTGTAALFVKTIDVETYAELKEELLKTFAKTPSIENVYRQLRTRRLSRNESVARYVLEMKQIAGDEIVEEELINIIIDGIGDPINTAAIRYSAKSVEELQQMLKKYEMIRPQKNSVQRVNIASSSTSPRNVSVVKNKNAIEEIRCYNCSKIGHYQSSCPSPRRPAGSCFLCHQMGHSYQNCPNRVKNTSAAITTQDREIVNSEQEPEELY
ncbi:uncharacterized protein LOC121593455 [Anopheles merus]|uniref:uncharacterized protein LOC121593455 n=1 Tax=Anopheles merus TaxID=30066 RepID=UPI001BE4A5AB|nr:uncharacterized protein LOC121593455 [Anopheles merus]